MIGWFRHYYPDDDIWLHYEVDDEGWVCRQVDLRGVDMRPTTAASLAEVMHARDTGGAEAVIAYERRFGVLAEACDPDGWHGQDDVEVISAEEFEQIWAVARDALENAGQPGS
ncbi:hypothetical protein G7043_13595 [Lentzea sp. NEAU-D13]|uniref:Uncharacterized protein n=1 Tax=Lentzea alba TaxID=2714351 RepID=A0A7C9VVA7_9PSEU|nr:hypothetical protein [Lentzea alba]NGY59958.1 hypothetical protein [Lentzea alba]